MGLSALHTWHCGSFCFEQKQPLVMGILNVTPDSFSDGGRYSKASAALGHAYDMLEAGADIVEVGGESTRPGSKEIAPAEELARVLPVVEALVMQGACVAVDSRHPQVISDCLDGGASIINDISGFTNPLMLELARQSKAGCVVVHMQGEPQTMLDNPQYEDVVGEVGEFLLTQAQLLLADGVEHARICIDPGPGFGKNFDQNLALLKNTAHFANLGSPPFLLMSAWSRKRFIGELTGEEVPSKRGAGSLTALLNTLEQGAGVLRVHDVGAMVQALKVWNALR